MCIIGPNVCNLQTQMCTTGLKVCNGHHQNVHYRPKMCITRTKVPNGQHHNVHYRPKMCVAGPKVFNGQHQNISGHYPSFLRKIQIWARANNEKKKQAVHLYCLQFKQNIMYIYI
jgi:hypothetical protein